MHGRIFAILFAFIIVVPAGAQNLEVLGFSDVNYHATEGGGPHGFRLGQLVGHVAAALSDRVAIFGEVSATPRPTEFTLEVERLILRYDVADYLKLSAGRYHTPVGYWNAAYHHGLWLQTSVARPEMIKFGGRFIPVHFVGLLAEGSFPKTALAPGYFIGIGNGRHANIARGGDAGDENSHKAILAGVSARPDFLFGLNLGGAVYRDRIEGDPFDVDETIFTAHVALQKEAPELIAEYAHVVHEADRAGADPMSSHGLYVQAGYRLPGTAAAFKPYVRWEEVNTPRLDPVFAHLGLDYEALIAGIRYDFAMLAALKAEYRNERLDSGERFNSLVVQISFVFPNRFSGN